MPIAVSSLSFEAESTIYQNEIRCRVSENEFNYTLNPSSTVAGTSGSCIDPVTGSDFQPYATSVGLYNDRDELLVVAKFAQPIPIPRNTDMTIVVRYDS